MEIRSDTDDVHVRDLSLVAARTRNGSEVRSQDSGGPPPRNRCGGSRGVDSADATAQDRELEIPGPGRPEAAAGGTSSARSYETHDPPHSGRPPPRPPLRLTRSVLPSQVAAEQLIHLPCMSPPPMGRAILQAASRTSRSPTT